MKKQFASALSAIVAMAVTFTTFADVESLAETGGYVPTAAPGLAFKNITLADLGTTVFPSVSKGGGYAGGEARVPLFCRTEVKNGDALQSVSYLAQWFDDGWLKCATITFTDGVGGVYAQTTDAKYIGSGVDAAYGTDFTGGTVGSVTDSASGNGYGFHHLALHTTADINSISINFNDTQASKLAPRTTLTAVGPSDYAVMPAGWSQMLGTNNNTLDGVTAVGDDGELFYASLAANVTITGTRGTWAWSGYTAASDVRYGYIDEDANYTTPTVTITNIPFDYYKVVFIPSTDTEDSKFGYITVNGKNYSSANTEKATDRDYDIVADSTDAWGKTQVSGYLHGVNYLVTPVHANNSAKTLTVTGHKSNGRGCIAAVQIVKAEVPDTLYAVTATGDVTWSTKAGLTVNSGTWASGNTIMLVNNQASPITVTFDEAVDASELILSGSGTTTIKFSSSAYNQIAAFNFNGVSGEVVLDDYMQTVSFTPPGEGAVRYKGTATLSAVPCASGAIPYTVIVDQPLTVSEFALAGVKSDYRFGDNFVGTFTRFVLGNNNYSNQKVTQLGGSIEVSGNSEPSTGNQSSVLLGHWGSLTVQLNTYGGTFTATNAASRLGHTGKCYWTIGDGESADDGTAIANLKGIVNQNGADYNGGSGSKVVLQQGGTLNLGESGVNVPNATFTLAGGKLATATAASVSVAAGTITSAANTDTEISTANGLTIASSIGGAGSVTKTGAGTLTLSETATSTGTLTINAGTVDFPAGVTWGGSIVLGENGTLNVVDASIDAASTVYIPLGASLTVGNGTVMVNGTAIDTDVWELSGGTFVNKNLKTAVTTATGDFAFSTATWESALGAGTQIDWSGSLSEVRVKAQNAAPAVATVDVDAANVATFAADGSGNMTFTAANGGSVSADAYDFSQTSGRIEYRLPTGGASVISGVNTLLLGGGSGAPTVASGQTLTLGPWGEMADSTTWTYSTMLTPAVGSTLLFAPGEGEKQRLAGGFGGTNMGTTIGVTNGTLVVHMAGGGDSVFFGANSVRIDNGGILSLEAQDALGYNNARNLTINKGGVLSVKVRDTLKRTVTLNGGTIELQGANSNQALDFFNSNIITVTDDSTIQAINDGSVSNPVIWFRSGTTVINIDDNKTLANNVTYESTSDGQSKGAVTIRGTLNQSTGNGVMQMNGFGGNPLTFVGTATIGESGKPVIYELNCEHQNGTYVVNSGSRFKGTGSVIGNGGVTLAAFNSKICGSLTVNNLKAASGGTFGDQWNAVSAKVATSYFATGTQTIENGSFTIGKDCVVTNAAGAADTTAATFSVKANGNLTLEKAVTVGGLTVADGGTITLKQATVGNTTALAVNGTMTQSGTLNIVLRYDSGIPLSVDRIPLIAASGLNVANITLDAGDARRRMKLVYENGVLYCVPKGGFFLKLY